MSADRTSDGALLDVAPGRPLWLVTLADLALLLVGFFVLLQANQTLSPRELARGIAQGFGVEPAPAAMPVASHGVADFAPGSAALPQRPDALLGWAKGELRDPRVRLTVTGGTDGSAQDVDPASHSATVLAADRARAVAAALVAAGVPDARLLLSTTPARGPRAVVVTLAFAGETPNKGTAR
ncbi:flagellar motor protein MotB [Sphingomonas sp. BE138]|uniref:OmpA family protein n=1 Tax=Sphingomonas sp. BE138 TaxID=2817845 RepID=UPI0028594613|nr:OmpA family protein [Sphingomonas sp. BE138]MDR6788963.1 flagellar motor protein MotB [Sphingomonas sp. BE138]